MKIAIFSDNFYPELSGISDSILISGLELASRGHLVEYFVPWYPKQSYEKVGLEFRDPDLPKNVKINRLRSFTYAGPTLQGRAVIPNLLRNACCEEKFDVIHTSTPFGAGIEALILARRFKIPLVGTNHTHIASFTRYAPIDNNVVRKFAQKYFNWYYNHCQIVSTPSHFLIDEMKTFGLKAHTEVISNPIDPAFFTSKKDKATLKRELGLSPFTILYVGRIASEKNVSLLMDGFIPFAKTHPDAYLVVIGGGVLRKDLEEQARKNGLANQVRFTGVLMGKNRQELLDYFHAADVFVEPSVSETQCMVALQALASGLPLLAARAGALPELANIGNTQLFDPASSKEMVELLEKLYLYGTATEAASGAQKICEHHYSPNTIAEKWENIYTKAINIHRGRHEKS